MRTRSCIFHVLRRCEDEQKAPLKQDATNIHRVVKQGWLAAMNCRRIGSEKIGVHTFEQFDSGLKTNNVGSTDLLYQSNTESNIQSSQHWHTGFIHLILKLFTFGHICQHIPPSLLNFQRKMNLNEVGTTSAPTTRKDSSPPMRRVRSALLRYGWVEATSREEGPCLDDFSLFIMSPKDCEGTKVPYRFSF